MEKFIVAEISKNWPETVDDMERWVTQGRDRNGYRRLLSERFEDAINRNDRKGYRLISWRLDRQWRASRDADHMNETIIAVFELIEIVQAV